MAHLDLHAAAQPWIPTLPDAGAFRAAAVGTWRGRMRNEHGSHRVFLALAAQFEAAGFPEEAAQCRVFSDEEREHGARCAGVVLALGGDATTDERTESSLPLHADATPRAALLRNVVSICCLSETVAVALVGAERLELGEANPLHATLTAILADEVGHARFGWNLLAAWAPALSAEERSQVDAYLPTAFRHQITHQHAHLPDAAPPPAGAEFFGVCSGTDARLLFRETLEQVVIPGLDAHGFRAREAWSRVAD